MKNLISRLQTDLNRLQTTLQKEGNDLIKRIKKVHLKENIDSRRRELEKLLGTKLKKLEPMYNRFLKEVKKNAKVAGIDLDRIEKEIKKTAEAAQKKFHLSTKTKKKTTKVKSSKIAATGDKKTAKKKTLGAKKKASA